jgi:hypothetical protein
LDASPANAREELIALRRLAELEAKAGNTPAPKASSTQFPVNIGPSSFKQSVNEAIAADSFPMGAKLVAGAGTALDNAALRLKQMVTGLTPQDDNKVAGNRAITDTGAGFAGNIAGNLAMLGGPVARATTALAPQVARVLPNAVAPTVAAGAVNAAVAPATNPLVGDETALGNAGMGMAGGMLGDLGARGAARLVQPIMQSDAVKTLLSRGVVPTPGQAVGGRLGAVEERLSSAPVIGDAINSAKTRGIGELNRAVYDSALNPIGQKSTAPLGREGVLQVKESLSDAYENLLPKLKFQADPQFATELRTVQQMASQGLEPNSVKTFERILKDKVISKLTPQGLASGQTIKQVESELSRLIRGYSSDPSFDNRQIGNALKQVQQSIRDNLTRVNTGPVAQELQAINQGYANYATLRAAASNPAAKEGFFSPSQLNSAVRMQDRSVGKGNYATGKAKGQDLSDAAKSVMSPVLANSGTADRAFLAWMLANPIKGSGAVLGGLADSPMYSRAGSRYMLGDFAGQNRLSELLRSASPYSGEVGQNALMNLLGQQ